METRECWTCKKSKPFDAFRKYTTGKPMAHCRPCERDNVNRHNAQNRERIRENGRRWLVANRDQVNQRQAQRDRESPERAREKCRRFRLRRLGKQASKRKPLTLEQGRAHAAVFRAVERGDLVRPKACEVCDTGCSPVGHHDDYAKPLEVRWLCNPCHADVHGRTVWART